MPIEKNVFKGRLIKLFTPLPQLGTVEGDGSLVAEAERLERKGFFCRFFSPSSGVGAGRAQKSQVLAAVTVCVRALECARVSFAG